MTKQLKALIASKIADFFAGFGSPGEPETPQEMQQHLFARVMPMVSDAVAALEQSHQYARERDAENQDLMLTVGRLRVEREQLEASQL